MKAAIVEWFRRFVLGVPEPPMCDLRKKFLDGALRERRRLLNGGGA